MTTSQNGWRTDPATTTITVNGHPATVRKGDVARLLRWAALTWHHTVEPVRTISGYRSAAGNAATGTPVTNSNHRSATAVDINGSAYPYEYTHRTGWKNPMTATKVKAVRALLKRAPELTWGADFTSPYRDPMHVELAKGTTPAQIAHRLTALGVGYYRVSTPTKGHQRAACYKVQATGKANITRWRKVGTRVYITATLDGWALTKRGDWIKATKLERTK